MNCVSFSSLQHLTTLREWDNRRKKCNKTGQFDLIWFISESFIIPLFGQCHKVTTWPHSSPRKFPTISLQDDFHTKSQSNSEISSELWSWWRVWDQQMFVTHGLDISICCLCYPGNVRLRSFLLPMLEKTRLNGLLRTNDKRKQKKWTETNIGYTIEEIRMTLKK